MHFNRIHPLFVIFLVFVILIFCITTLVARYYFNEPVLVLTERVANKLIDKQGALSILGEILSIPSESIGSRITTIPTISIDTIDRKGSSEKVFFSPQHYDEVGRPIDTKVGISTPYADYKQYDVYNVKELLNTIKNITAGSVINLMPGIYHLKGKSVPITQPGLSNAPIVLRSNILGESLIQMSTLEGFHVQAPFWVFETLDVSGVCKHHSDCEHAFHVVGDGRSFVLRNSRVRDFNAHVKVNGISEKNRQAYPDFGLIEAIILNSISTLSSNNFFKFRR